MSVARRPLDIAPGSIISLTLPKGSSAYFEVLRRVGGGGSGSVYEALSDEGATVIIKGPRLIGDPSLDLRRERDHLRRFRHPNILRLIGDQEDPRGHILLCLERAFENPLLWLAALRQSKEGLPDAQLATLTLPAVLALELAYDLAKAVVHIHTHGAAHMDIKPQNLMLAMDHASGDLEPADYLERLLAGRWQGLLIDLGGLLERDRIRTLNTGTADLSPQLTPAFAPPEIIPGLDQPDGSSRAVYGCAADLYATGLTLAALLTGRGPYAHLEQPPPTGNFEAMADIKRAERRGELQPYDRDALAVLDVSDSLGRPAEELRSEMLGLVARLCDPDPRRRGTAAGLAQQLKDLLGIRPVELEQARAMRGASRDHPRTVRPYATDRLALDTQGHRFSDALNRIRGRPDRSIGPIVKGRKDFWR